jgi:hypothetical protein
MEQLQLLNLMQKYADGDKKEGILDKLKNYWNSLAEEEKNRIYWGGGLGLVTGLPLGLYATRNSGVLGKLLGTAGTMAATGTVGAVGAAGYNHFTDPFKKADKDLAQLNADVRAAESANKSESEIAALINQAAEKIEQSDHWKVLNKWRTNPNNKAVMLNKRLAHLPAVGELLAKYVWK